MLDMICRWLDRIFSRLSTNQLIILQAICLGLSVGCAVYSFILLGSNP